MPIAVNLVELQPELLEVAELGTEIGGMEFYSVDADAIGGLINGAVDADVIDLDTGGAI